MCRIHFRACRQAEALGQPFYFLLGGRAQPHLGVTEGGVDRLERFGQRDLRVGLFGRVDPQIEHRPCTGQLIARLFVFGQALLEQGERIVQRLLDLLHVIARVRLVVLLRPQQCLPAGLMLAAGAERRALQPRAELALQGFQQLQQVRAFGLGMTTGALQHPLQQPVALPQHRRAPRLRDFGAGGVAAGELGRHLLHGAVPATGLFTETVHGLVGRPAGGVGHHLRPPVDRLLPVTLSLGPGRLARRRCGVPQGIAPRTEILPRKGLYVACAAAAARRGHDRPPVSGNDDSNAASPRLTAWECAGSC